MDRIRLLVTLQVSTDNKFIFNRTLIDLIGTILVVAMTTPADTLELYHRLEPTQHNSLNFIHKRGSKDYPYLRKEIELLLKKAVLTGECVIDATESNGVVALHAQADKIICTCTSFAALRCTTKTLSGKTNASVQASALWQLPQESADTLLLMPSTDKGNKRVEAEILAAHNCLKRKGVLYAVMNKDTGAKRYEKFIKDNFARMDVIAKDKGWRLVKAARHSIADNTNISQHTAISFEASNIALTAQTGVYAAGKIDPGTKFLIEQLDFSEFANKQLLDIGCGYGLLSIKAALAGAKVTALDDDHLAVVSTLNNAKQHGVDINAVHSDIDIALIQDPKSFDVILMNPPFHLAKQVILDIPLAMMAAANKYLAKDGIMYIVANKALPYEVELEKWASVKQVALNNAFKVLEVKRK